MQFEWFLLIVLEFLKKITQHVKVEDSFASWDPHQSMLKIRATIFPSEGELHSGG